MMFNEDCSQENVNDVPLLERLKSVPLTARVVIQNGEFSYRNIPYGALCKDAYREISRLLKEVEKAYAEGHLAGSSALGLPFDECINAMERDFKRSNAILVADSRDIDSPLGTDVVDSNTNDNLKKIVDGLE